MSPSLNRHVDDFALHRRSALENPPLPDVIGPSVAADRSPMAAPEIRAIDQEAATARISRKVIFWRGRVADMGALAGP
jgi:hypothetical protein